MQKPEISGVEYQQGELAGYELREYLLEKLVRGKSFCYRKNFCLAVNVPIVVQKMYRLKLSTSKPVAKVVQIEYLT
jgi:hypothetical protein